MWQKVGVNMAKIFKFSGYFVLGEKTPFGCYRKWDFMNFLIETVEKISNKQKHSWQQLHCEESENFEIDGELDDNCDLALLERHFKHNSDISKFDRPLPQAGEKYKHFKIGKIVEVIGISRHTENQEWTVVYRYEDKIWNRPLDMFMSEVDHEKYPDVAQKYRFELVEE